MVLLEFLEELNDSQTIDEAWSLLSRRMAEYGFDRLLYGFTRTHGHKLNGDPLDALLLTNHREEFLQRFIGDRLYLHAPMVQWAAENIGACSWSWIEENRRHLTKEELEVVDFNQQMGIIAGYSISFKDVSKRAKGMISLVAEPGMTQQEVDALWGEHGRLIVQMNNVTHLKLTSLPYRTLRRPLTDRQREVLEWVGDGKTTQDIATIMGLTQATVEKHLRLARDALDVDTTAQAVLKASFQNQIFVLND